MPNTISQKEFNDLLAHKNATALLLERIFKPEKYPEFHAYLDFLHERWIASWKTKGN